MNILRFCRATATIRSTSAHSYTVGRFALFCHLYHCYSVVRQKVFGYVYVGVWLAENTKMDVNVTVSPYIVNNEFALQGVINAK